MEVSINNHNIEQQNVYEDLATGDEVNFLIRCLKIILNKTPLNKFWCPVQNKTPQHVNLVMKLISIN